MKHPFAPRFPLLPLASGLLVALLGGSALAGPARIRTEATVSGEIIRLGNLVEGLEQGADIPLFRAPAPGTRGTIRVERVLSAARELGITNIDFGDFRTVHINRPARTIARADMAQAVSKAMAARGNVNNLDVVLDEHLGPRMVDAARLDALKIMQLNRDPVTGRFEAKLALADDQASEVWTITGAVLETREIAVLTNDVERGDALKEKDLTVVRRPANQVGADVIGSMSDLIGMVPRKALRTGELIHSADLAKPMLVEKNQLISVVYASKGLSLTMRGRAQANGAMGETIRIQNPQSKRIVEGVVSGPGQVIITAPAPAPVPLAAAR
jgi:flagella basal body P-ring formation protein FlgA